MARTYSRGNVEESPRTSVIRGYDRHDVKRETRKALELMNYDLEGEDHAKTSIARGERQRLRDQRQQEIVDQENERIARDALVRAGL